MSALLERIWYRRQVPPLGLRPLAAAYAAIADRRAGRQRAAATRLPVPVIVVGNIAVGGTGKTPCVQWVVETLREIGRQPGILSRGYGGRGPFPCLVTADSDPAVCGDEPLLLARRTVAPLACAPDRAAAARRLLAEHPGIDVLVCDDGLQHYRLARDLEICVIDGTRGHGNGWRLPAGPLREPPLRAARCALIFVNGADPAPYGERALRFDLAPDDAVALDGGERRSVTAFAGTPVYAIAGIGRPQRFFDALRAQGLQPAMVRAFPDHHRYRARDLAFARGAPLLMTEKDAVKCTGLGVADLWSVPVTPRFDPVAAGRVRQCLQRALDASAT